MNEKTWSKSTPWVLALDGSLPGNPLGFHCCRCGATENVAHPVAPLAYLRRSLEFLERHKACPPPRAPGVFAVGGPQ